MRMKRYLSDEMKKMLEDLIHSGEEYNVKTPLLKRFQESVI